MPELIEDELRRFFEAYNATFEQGPRSIADCYHEPCITARMGATTLNPTRADCAAFFASVLEKYRARGWVRGELVELQARPLGANSALATIVWAYLDEGGKTLWEWTFSYNLYRSNGQWKILLQTLHDT